MLWQALLGALLAAAKSTAHEDPARRQAFASLVVVAVSSTPRCPGSAKASPPSRQRPAYETASCVPTSPLYNIKESPDMNKKFTTFMLCIMFTAGLSLLLYPFISNQWNNYRQSRLITTYDTAIAELDATGQLDYTSEREKALSYNEALTPYILPDSFSSAQVPEEGSEEYLSCLNLTGDGMMGYVQIPKINVRIPIYHTTTEEVLQKAAGHLAGSSLPVGGVGTHAVISAHRGLPSAALFTDLDKLEEGDHFLLSVLDDTLCYEVDQISVVEPTDTHALVAEADADLVTLLTCTPYGVNSHRLLVRGHRIPYEDVQDDIIPAASAILGASLHTSYLLWVLVGLGVTGVFILLLYSYDRRQKKSGTTIKEQNNL